MSGGFTQRYDSHPGNDTIRRIEGVTIIDQPPPGSIRGVDTGVVCCVGEFTDCRHAVLVNATTGAITTKCAPREVYSMADLVNNFGGFDETLGKFGAECGNGYVSLKNKSFSRLVVAAVDHVVPASGTQYGVRLWRELPTNTSATNPTPFVPMQAGVVYAGREFGSGSTRVRVARKVEFTAGAAYTSGVNGTVATDPSAVTQNFDRAAGSFITDGVQVGDILVVGALSTGSGANLTDAGNFRITAVTDANTVVVQRMDGVAFAWAAAATGTLAWRIHPAAAADTAGSLAAVHVALASATGYVVPARPLAASIAAATQISPTVVPTAASATVWDPLSGLKMAVHPTGDTTNGLIYDADVHAPNTANTALMSARYITAIAATNADAEPSRDINVMVAARKASVIRAYMKGHVLTASEQGLTRRAVHSPELDDVLATATAVGSTDPAVGALRTSRLDYAWPGLCMYVQEAVGFTIPCADGTNTTDGILDDTSDFWLASIESNLAPERNPAQTTAPVPGIMANVLGFQRGLTAELTKADYIALRAAGVCAPRNDRSAGWIFQSGVCTSITAGQTNISTRRMADYIQDGIADRLTDFNKQPLTQALRDAAVGEVAAWLEILKSTGNPAASRITDYQVDDQSGNTPESLALGIYVIIVRVRLTPTADFIVLQTEIGEGVRITELAA